jgi:hypothetical protein
MCHPFHNLLRHPHHKSPLGPQEHSRQGVASFVGGLVIFGLVAVMILVLMIGLYGGSSPQQVLGAAAAFGLRASSSG